MPNPICSTDCGASIAPVQFDACAPETNLSEIEYVFIAPANAPPFNDWSDANEWNERLSNDETTGNFIRQLTVIGDQPLPSETSIPISGNRTKVVNKTYTLNVTIDESNDKNHQFIRMLECGGQVRVWYETIGSIRFGGNAGILGYITLDMILNRGRNEIITYNGIVTWRDLFTPERTQVAGEVQPAPVDAWINSNGEYVINKNSDYILTK